MLNNAQKYVASTNLKEPLPSPNSTLLRGDIAGAVAALKASNPVASWKDTADFQARYRRTLGQPRAVARQLPAP